MNVDLSGRGLTSFQEVIELIGEDNLSEVTHLSLYNNQLTSFEHFPNLSKVTRLHLYNNQLTSFEHFPSPSNLPELVHLNLWNNQLTSFEHFPILPKLRDLYLGNNPISQFNITLIQLKKAYPIRLSLVRRRTLRKWIASHRSRTLCTLLEMNRDSPLFDDFREGFLLS
jgi:Leucine-rich repeat (LRR) protein